MSIWRRDTNINMVEEEDSCVYLWGWWKEGKWAVDGGGSQWVGEALGRMRRRRVRVESPATRWLSFSVWLPSDELVFEFFLPFPLSLSFPSSPFHSLRSLQSPSTLLQSLSFRRTNILLDLKILVPWWARIRYDVVYAFCLYFVRFFTSMHHLESLSLAVDRVMRQERQTVVPGVVWRYENLRKCRPRTIHCFQRGIWRFLYYLTDAGTDIALQGRMWIFVHT